MIAGENGKCREVNDFPLFTFLRSVVDCEGSKIEYLLAGGRVNHKREKTLTFLAVVRRMLRDRPMPADEFHAAIQLAHRRYGPTEFALENRGCTFLSYTCNLIGQVELTDGRFVYMREPRIAIARDKEFSRRKYAHMDKEQVAFLRALFELAELTKQMRNK